MRHLTVYKRFFTQSDCYKASATSRLVGVQVHSTGANNPYLRRYVQPDDGRLGLNTNGNSHNRPGVDVCANAYIGKLMDGTVAVYQTLPWDVRCWISGKGENGNANKIGYIGFEICEDNLTDLIYFEKAVMGAAVNLTAYLCSLMGVRPDDAVIGTDGALAVMDHSELSACGLASGHADITHWLRRFGKRMSDFRRAVAEAMDEGVEIEYIDAEEVMEEMDKAMYEIVSPNGGYVNLREQPDLSSASLARLMPGERVAVTAMTGVWSKVLYNDETVGYVMTQYLHKAEEQEAEDVGSVTIRTVLEDSKGNTWEPDGDFCVRTVVKIDGENID